MGSVSSQDYLVGPVSYSELSDGSGFLGWSIWLVRFLTLEYLVCPVSCPGLSGRSGFLHSMEYLVGPVS